MPPEYNSACRSATRQRFNGVQRRNADYSQTLDERSRRVLARSCDASAIIVAWELRFFPTAEASRPARALCSHGIFLGLLGTALRGTHFGRKVCFPRIFFSFVHHRIAAKTRKLECIDPYIRAPHESPLLCPRVPGTQRARLADALVVHPNWLSGSTGSAGGAGFQQHHVCHASSG